MMTYVLQSIDFLIIFLVLYKIGKIFKGTRALSILLGMIVTAILYGISIHFQLQYTKQILQYVFQNIVLIIIILFQEEIRKTFSEFGRKTTLFQKKNVKDPEEVAEILSNVAFNLGNDLLGALIVIEQDIALDHFKELGSLLNADINQQLMYSLFTHKSTLHDGAIILKDYKIESAGCILPLSKNPNLDKKLGTRHRAALGLSEVSDALIIIVSEETGEVKLVSNGQLTVIKNKNELKTCILKKEKQILLKSSFKDWFNFNQEK
jgi:diadenylate cyclase